MFSRAKMELLSFEKSVIDLLSVRMIVGFVASHKMFEKMRKAMEIARNAVKYFEYLSCAWERIFDPNATRRTSSVFTESFDLGYPHS